MGEKVGSTPGRLPGLHGGGRMERRERAFFFSLGSSKLGEMQEAGRRGVQGPFRSQHLLSESQNGKFDCIPALINTVTLRWEGFTCVFPRKLQTRELPLLRDYNTGAGSQNRGTKLE